MRQIKAYRSFGLLIAGTLLCAVSCVIETDDDDDGGVGGTTNVATGGTTSTNTAKVGGATAKGGSTARGGATATGGKTGAGGSTTAVAGSSSVAGTSAAIGGSSAIAGNAGTPGAGGSAGSSSSGVAGATGSTCLDSTKIVSNPQICAGIPTQCNGGNSLAYQACGMAWATYAAPVANEIQHCMALIPVSQDLCNVTQAALDFCVSSTVASVCTTDLASATCAVLAGTCTTLDVSACQKRISADLGYDSATFAACLVTSTVTDCNAKILGCM